MNRPPPTPRADDESPHGATFGRLGRDPGRPPRTGPAPAAPDEKGADKVFVGYLYGQPRDLNFRLYTHLCHAFLVADGEGKVRRGPGVPSRELTAEAHRAGVKVLLSLGGWGWDKQFAAIVSKPEAEDRYVTSVMEIVDGDDYDGIDLDWEYPDTKEEVVGFERLSRRFRKELDAIGEKKGRPMVLTMAASANPGTLRWLGKEFLLETMDWINVMTYDFTGDWTRLRGPPLAPLRLVEAAGGAPRSTELTMKYLLEERGLPADRLAVGIPLYGRGFAVAEPYASTKGAPKARIPQGRLRQPPPAPARGGLDAELGRRDQEPLAHLARPLGRDRLRRRRVGRPQDRVGDEAGLPRRLLLAGRRRPPARRDQPPPGCLSEGMGELGGPGRCAASESFRAVTKSPPTWVRRELPGRQDGRGQVHGRAPSPRNGRFMSRTPGTRAGSMM